MRGSGEFGAFSPPSLRRPEIVPRPPRATAMPIRSALTDPEPTSRPRGDAKIAERGAWFDYILALLIHQSLVQDLQQGFVRITFHGVSRAMDTNHCACIENT